MWYRSSRHDPAFQPSEELFELLRTEYSQTVGGIGASPAQKPGQRPHEKRLAEHLVTLYLLGCLDVDADGGWVIDTMPTGAGRCALKLATVSQQSGVHVVCPTGVHLPLYFLVKRAVIEF